MGHAKLSILATAVVIGLTGCGGAQAHRLKATFLLRTLRR